MHHYLGDKFAFSFVSPAQVVCDSNNCCHVPLVRDRFTWYMRYTSRFFCIFCVYRNFLVSSLKPDVNLGHFFALFWSDMKPNSVFYASGGAFSEILRGASGGPSGDASTSGGAYSGPPSAGGDFFGSLRSPDLASRMTKPADLPTKVS